MPLSILLTNDDGIEAPGIRAMFDALRTLGRLTVAAPTEERSAVSHAISIHYPVQVFDHRGEGGYRGCAVSGTPADCVKVAVRHLMDVPPDIVVSGMNFGANVGANVLYSGTVAAAVEGGMAGVRSVAVSLEATKRPNFAEAARLAREMIERLAFAPHCPRVTNINIPAIRRGVPKGIKIAPHEIRTERELFEPEVEPGGRRQYRPLWSPSKMPPETGSDCHWLEEGYITITPLRIEMTDTEALEGLADDLGLP